MLNLIICTTHQKRKVAVTLVPVGSRQAEQGGMAGADVCKGESETSTPTPPACRLLPLPQTNTRIHLRRPPASLTADAGSIFEARGQALMRSLCQAGNRLKPACSAGYGRQLAVAGRREARTETAGSWQLAAGPPGRAACRQGGQGRREARRAGGKHAGQHAPQGATA